MQSLDARNTRSNGSRENPTSQPHFYAAIDEDTEGREVIQRLTANPAFADDPIRPAKRVERLPFTPSAHSRRFWLVEFDWAPRFPRLEGLNPRQKHEAEQRWLRESETMAPPASLVDVPPHVGCMNEFYAVPDEGPLERSVAMLAAAERNAKAQLRWETDGECRRWTALVEEGAITATPLGSIFLEENGLGVLQVDSTSIIRLVRPTADELARFPIPAEGGGR